MYSAEKKRYIELSWKIIEYKLFYYYPDKVHHTWHSVLTITDAEYDALEIEYLNLCVELGLQNTVVHKATTDGTINYDYSKENLVYSYGVALTLEDRKKHYG